MDEPNPPRSASRSTRLSQPELLQRGAIAEARKAVLERRRASGDGVTQADVDLVADALVGVAVRPYPRAIVSVIGGSLSTVGPLFEDWWQRFVLRGVDPASPSIDLPTQVTLRIRHLLAELESAIRTQIKDVANPTQALLAAVQLGTQHGLKAQLLALQEERDRLHQSVEALTYKAAELEAQLAARTAAQREDQQQLTAAINQLQRRFESLGEELNATRDSQMLARITNQVRLLRRDLSGLGASTGRQVTRRKSKRARKVAPRLNRSSARSGRTRRYPRR